MRIKCNNACKILWSEHSKGELEASYCCLEPCHSKCGPHTSNLCITWELIRNAESQAPTDSCIFTSSPGGLDAHCSWRNIDLEHRV